MFVAFGKVSDALAEVQLKIHVRNATKNPFSGQVEYMLLQPDGTEVARLSDKIQVKAGRATTVSDRMPVKQTDGFGPLRHRPCITCWCGYLIRKEM